MKFKAILFVALVAIMGTTSVNAASMYGTGATYSQYFNGNHFWSTHAVAGAGAEFISPAYTVDVSETTIAYDFNTSFTATGQTNGPMIRWDETLNWTDWSIVTNTIGGFDLSRILSGGDFIQLNMQGLTANGQIVLANNSLSPVPVPAAAWLFGSALLGFVGFSRKKKVS